MGGALVKSDKRIKYQNWTRTRYGVYVESVKENENDEKPLAAQPWRKVEITNKSRLETVSLVITLKRIRILNSSL